MRDCAAGSVDPAILSRALQVMDNQTRRLGRLSDQLLELGRIDNGQLRLKLAPVECGRLVDNVVAMMKGVTPSRAFATAVDPGLWVQGDAHRLEEILTNVLENAVKYSPLHTSVAVRGYGVDGHVRISVTDEGPGINPEHLPHVFERMYRARPDLPGLGLGLYVSQCIAEAHGGHLEAESPAGGGACFTLLLPAFALRDRSCQAVP
jgi:signal transduction histidine kinase